MLLGDGARPEAVARRRRHGHRTARENIADPVDPGSFSEYGAFAVAAQRARRPIDELEPNTPADGLVAGIGRVNGDRFGPERPVARSWPTTTRCWRARRVSGDHRKKDRLFELVERLRLPVVFFTEGGGGRPGDTDAPW